MARFSNYQNSRAWMYNRIDSHTNSLSSEFIEGVEVFMQFASQKAIAESSGGIFYCPCNICKNDKFFRSRKIWNQLLSRGFMPNYYIWHKHGEKINVSLGASHDTGSHSTSRQSDYELPPDNCIDMVHDAFPTMTGFNKNGETTLYEEQPNTEAQQFFNMLEAANTPLYEGCKEGHTQISLASRFMNNKCGQNMSERGLDSWAELFTEYLPKGNHAISFFYEMEKLMRNLGLQYYTIDVCVNKCMIFWREDKKWETCRFCQQPRFKTSEGRTKIPFSKMWYLPIVDLLKRMYQSKLTSASMRWHFDHQTIDGEMCHPSDGVEWNNFQQQHPEFAAEPTNVYLGLCTNGFNPFGMSRNHSLWPVILTPYNLLPCMCMKKEYLFLTILNSCPNHPRSIIDVFLKPLIEELKELWLNGVEAYDVSTNQNFIMKVVLLWTISDFPTYGMLSGWTTHGRLSCIICMDRTKAFWLPNGRKSSWFDCHRRFLSPDHPLRKSKNKFLKGKHAVNDYAPSYATGSDIYDQITEINPSKMSTCGGNGQDTKKAGYGRLHNWHKESIMWELPYWKDLNLRHNLDIMHIEKNFVDNIIFTLMNQKEKSKDNVNSRLDIKLIFSRKELHLDSNVSAPFPIFRLTREAKEELLNCVKHNVKFPDGYFASLETCVDIEGGKFSGMKSHDCHVFMERLLLFIMGELLPRNVHQGISGISLFFRDLCSRSLDVQRVQLMKENIALILCNLEKIFPPSFFDVMEHLPIHLPHEAELGGPVQYRWMYPFERFFKDLKSKAKNKRYAAGSYQRELRNKEEFLQQSVVIARNPLPIWSRSPRSPEQLDLGFVLCYGSCAHLVAKQDAMDGYLLDGTEIFYLPNCEW